MFRELIIASNNTGKIREFNEMFSPLGITVHSQKDYQISETEEPYPTFIENALAKARHVSKYTGLPALADDSGICVNALGGAPGVHSARYAGDPKSDVRNNRKLIDDLKKHEDKSASYYCVLVYLRHADDPNPIIAEAWWEGEVISTPRGSNGFGYDPYFFIPSLGKTAAELLPEEKNKISHRGQALRVLVDKMRTCRIFA